MKTSLLIIVMLFLVSAAVGQSLIATTDAPVDFMVNETMLPAGHYQVISETYGSILNIQNTDSGQAVKVFVRSVKHSCAESKFIFATHQGKHILHRLCLSGGRAFDLIHPTDIANPVLPE